MKKTLQLLNQTFISSYANTLQFNNFARAFKNDLKKELATINATDIQISTGHFYLSGFFTVNSQPVYFSIKDVRFFNDKMIMYRKAKNYSDYSGGTNNYTPIQSGMANIIKSTLAL